jgi:hypothetical protein
MHHKHPSGSGGCSSDSDNSTSSEQINTSLPNLLFNSLTFARESNFYVWHYKMNNGEKCEDEDIAKLLKPENNTSSEDSLEKSRRNKKK